MQRLLKDYGLDVSYPAAQKTNGHFWLQLASGPFDIPHIMPLLKSAADAIDDLRPQDQNKDDPPVVTKLDVTRDLRRTFFAPGQWQLKYGELKDALEQAFDTTFKDNGNSFDSCF